MTDERQAGLLDDPCTFVPAHEPWSCAVHRGGHRTSLDQERCNLAAPPESIVANGRLYILGDLAGKFADLAEQSRDPSLLARLRLIETEARDFIELHDAEDGVDPTWPCTGQCIQARGLRRALGVESAKEEGS